MATLSSAFSGSLKSRILLQIVLPTVLIFGLFILMNVYNKLEHAKSFAAEQIAIEADSVARQIEIGNKEALQSARLLAESQSSALFGNREASSRFAHEVLQNNPGFLGVYFGYEPNADGQDLLYGGSEGHDDAGRFLPYWYRDGDELKVTPLADMETSLYYDGIRKQYQNTGELTGLVTEPYVYDGMLLIEHVAPIVMDGKFVGIAGVDRSLGFLEDYLKSAASDGSGGMTLLSRGNHVIASTVQSSLATRHISETPYKEAYERALKSPGEVLTVDSPVDGDEYYYIAIDIPSGGWKLIKRISTTDLMAPIYSTAMKEMLVLLVIIGVICAIALVFTGSIVRRTRNTLNLARQVAAGRVAEVDTQGVNDDSGDEIDALYRRTQKVAMVFQRVAEVCESIANGQLDARLEPSSDEDAISHSVNAMAERLQAAATEMKTHSTQVLSGTNTQAAEIDSVATAMQEMHSTIREVSTLATESSDQATEAVSATRTVKRTLEEAVGSVTSLSEDMSETSKTIEAVADSSENINKIIDVINMIAEQTNLLALNAAIEAARAGEQGRGFAVVADEVRTLAAKTQSSTEEISSLISDLRGRVGEAVAMVGQGLERASDTVEATSRANDALSSVSNAIDVISEHMIQVATAVEEQSMATEEINGNITRVKDASTSLADLVSKK